MEDKITRMKELINILNKASELYYQKKYNHDDRLRIRPSL